MFVNFQIVALKFAPPGLDCQALCQFLSDKHRLAKVKLFGMPAEVLVAALSTESSTMDELECLQCVSAILHCTVA